MKNILITGAKGNLGIAVVNKFVGVGYNVIGTVSARESVQQEIPNLYLEYVSVDLTDSEVSKNFVDIVLKKCNQIDGAVLTVGGFVAGDLTKTSKSDFEKMFSLNFISAFNIAQPVFAQMLQQPEGGKIILIGSKPGLHGSEAKGSVAYGFTKSLLFRLAELINYSGNKKNVCASVIIPSTIDTPQNRAAMPHANFNDWVKTETIANAVFELETNTAFILSNPVLEIYSNTEFANK